MKKKVSKTAMALLILGNANADGSNVQITGPFTSKMVLKNGRIAQFYNTEIILAAKMHRLRGLN